MLIKIHLLQSAIVTTNTTIPREAHLLCWRADAVAKLMRTNKIRDRAELARRIQLGRSTVYRTFDADWSGPVSATVLAQIAATFGVRLARLVIEPEGWR